MNYKERRDECLKILTEIEILLKKYGRWMSCMDSEIFFAYRNLEKAKNRLIRQINFFNKFLSKEKSDKK